MSKKRKCRYTPEELALHKEAVRLRNMTDKQLVEEFHRAADTELVVSSPSVAQDGTEVAGAYRGHLCGKNARCGPCRWQVQGD